MSKEEKTGKEKGRRGGFTGLDVAIMIAAFVVVATVFAFVVLSAGTFSTEKAVEVPYEKAVYVSAEEWTGKLLPVEKLAGRRM